MSHSDPAATVCANCHATLGGAFCQACGQKAVGPDVSLHDFFHEAFHEFLHVDGKIVQTLRLLLTKPGMLTKEFLDGRRVRYISPLRVYLTCSVVFFALAAFVPDSRLTFVTVTYKASPGDPQLDPAEVLRYEREASLRAGRAVVHDLPRVMFALMPVFALGTWVLYRKARRFYAAHLYYSIHFHAFAFLAFTLEVSLILLVGRYVSLAGRNARGLAFLGPTAIAVYHFVGLRRVFGGSFLATLWKSILLWAVYVFVILLSIVAVAWFSGAIRSSGPPQPAPHETRSSDYFTTFAAASDVRDPVRMFLIA
jgi:hypothetical protein